MRSNSYLAISDFISQYDEYTTSLIGIRFLFSFKIIIVYLSNPINLILDHLIELKINHWDTAIRELTAKTIYKLTKRVSFHLFLFY